MKELKDLRVDGKSTFLTLSAGLPATTSLAMFAGNSGAMIAGHEGTITSIDYEEVLGINTPLAPAGGQKAYFKNAAGEVEEYLLAKEGEKLQAVTVRFDTGRTMTLGLLLQGQGKTLISFKGDSAPTPATELNLGNVEAKLIGRRFKCTKYFRDASNPQVRNSGQANERSTAANCYEFIETTV